MKLSELIKQLQEKLEKHGDLTATCYHLCAHVKDVQSISIKFRLKTKSRYFSSNYWNEDSNAEKEKGEMVLGVE